jgi:hypothetical protein
VDITAGRQIRDRILTLDAPQSDVQSGICFWMAAVRRKDGNSLQKIRNQVKLGS